jgi:hypothetical protein
MQLRQLALCLLGLLFFIGPAGVTTAISSEPLPQEHVAFFEARIRPVLVTYCYECHSADSKIVRGGLLLDSRAGIQRGGDSGSVLAPLSPEDSLLLQSLKHESMEMPPDEKLPDSIIADFEQWIRLGAPDPREEVKATGLKPVDWDAARSHWAFQPIVQPEIPSIGNDHWSESPIDRFVIDRLRQNAMEPATKADKRVLIRRATFDLTGLPPTVQEVNAFLQDSSPNAFATVVDRLLESPTYGERWGRHWLDLVRYATTNGADENHELPNAWKFRDWVVRKMNDDLPMDQFIVHQLAGDLLPAPEDEVAAGDLLTATGMLVIGPKMLAEQDKDKMIFNIVDEQIDTVSRTMLGLTISCARCHDHKFDPISTEDYYSLAGIFSSTKTMADRNFVSNWMERPLPSQSIATMREDHQRRINEAKGKLESAKSLGNEELTQKATAEVETLEKAMPAFEMVMAVTVGEPHDLPVHIRGNHLRPGDAVIPRGMPEILTSVATPPSITSSESGRLQLAQWIVSPQNPLTARVMANRIWMWHFGQPLMRSPSNWGLQAEEPTHPELLDWLAKELIRSGWSMKSMHRTIMLSATYQMSSHVDAATVERDPENRVLARQNRRRLEAEPIRDAILFVGHGLNPAMGKRADDVNSLRRAIYLPIDRAALYEMFSTFDYVETANHIEQRPVTTVPNQALFLMNSPIVHDQARRLIELNGLGTVEPASPSAAAGVSTLFEQLFSRPPTVDEISLAVQFLEQAEQVSAGEHTPDARRSHAWAALCRTLIAGNEFLYVE